MHQPKNIEELALLMDQAVFEFKELAVCSVDDLEDELYDYATEFEAMAKSLEELKEQLATEGENVLGKGLKFMQRAIQLRQIIPFFNLIETIDIACRHGVTGR